MRRASKILTGILVTSILVARSASGRWEVGGDLQLELRGFPQGPAHVGQDDTKLSPSAALQPEFRLDIKSKDSRFTFRPFIRWDADDDERSHFDVRELNFLHFSSTWDLLVGWSRVFWGVTESVHLVDIINQTDAVEDIDSEDKLGQPMINVNSIHDSGTYSFFLLPGFRERTFPSDSARRRGQFPVDVDNATFESDAGNRHVDYAFRWSNAIGDWDIGASYFYGTSREPRLIPVTIAGERVVLRPQYDLIHQFGVDLQYTKAAWLWKLEAIARIGHGRPFVAAVGGFEYTFFGIRESSADLGLLAELQYDGRESSLDAPAVASDNDIFIAARLALNDEKSTSALVGVSVDVVNGTTFGAIEAQRRLSTHWMAELEARLFVHTDSDDPLFAFRRDGSITLRMTYSF